MKKAIELKNVSFKYKSSSESVLSNFSLTINQGEWVSLLGHNGSGKSTLSKIMAGLVDVDSGSVEIFGKKYNQENLYNIRKQISVVFQNPDSQFVGATVEDDIAFGLENHFYPVEKMNDIILDVLKRVDMKDFINSAPHDLSGGQKQKVAIAGVFAISPQIIIFDEATAMLDPKGVKEVNNLIEKINKEKNITVITITHNMEEAAKAQRLVIIEKGIIVFDDKPQNIIFDETRLKSLQLNSPFNAKISNEIFNQGLIQNKSMDIDEVIKWLK